MRLVDRYPMKDNGMFLLKRPDFDDIGEEVLKEYMPSVLNYPKAVDIEYLAEECLYLDIKHEYLSSDGKVLGLIAFSDTQFPTTNLEAEPTVIDVEEGTMLIDMSLIGTDKLPRKRFTEAHESAHWICHRTYHSPTNRLYDFRKNKPMVVCRRENIEQYKRRISGTATEEDWEEWQADCLAAALLMPKSTFVEAFGEAMRSNGLLRNYLQPGVDDNKAKKVIAELMHVFNVSNRATQIRMNHLGMIRK